MPFALARAGMATALHRAVPGAPRLASATSWHGLCHTSVVRLVLEQTDRRGTCMLDAASRRGQLRGSRSLLAMGVASMTLSEERLNVGIPGNLCGRMIAPARVGPDAFSSVAAPEVTLRRWRGLDAGLSPLSAPSHRRRRSVSPSGRGAALLKPEGSSVCLLAGHQASPGLADTSQSDTVCRTLSSSPTDSPCYAPYCVWPTITWLPDRLTSLVPTQQVWHGWQAPTHPIPSYTGEMVVTYPHIFVGDWEAQQVWSARARHAPLRPRGAVIP
jgi:hypothetical protein